MSAGQVRPAAGPAGGTPDRLLRVVVGAAVAWMAGYVVLTALGRDRPRLAMFVGDIVYLVPLVAGVLVAGLAVRRSRGRHRTLWRLLTVAFVAQLAGECAWAGYDYLTEDGPPAPSVADLGYLTASTVMVIAVLVGFGGAGRLRHLRGLVDSTLIIVTLGALGWRMLVQPQLTEAVTAADLVNLAYPLLDVVLLACLGIVGMAGHDSVPLSVRLVGAAGAVNAVSDMVYIYLAAFSAYDSGGWVDAGFEAASMLCLLAAVVAVRRPESPARPLSFDRGLPLLPILMALTATSALVVFDKVRTGAVGDLTLIVVGVLFLTVMLRQYLFAADRAGLAEQLARAVEEQQRLAVTDGLTGLYNRRYLMTQVERLGAAAGGAPVSLMVVDLDHFKLVNDTFGHLAGDAVLAAAATRIASAARADDVVARYGGEEFVVLLAGADAPEARSVAERVRRHLRETPIVAGGAAISVTASIGVASAPDGSVRQLLEAADRALYRAKAEGRDRVSAAVTPTADPVAV
ncbi:hypothetical protein GCM10020358_34170 [Amorphoplanes nipponensis]|uniref:GGDEF domain-containing protein n=1 Tax=Actinoplanes nipponensis TaxID=135950 RepID=A0A919MTH3_9ACTN|nr:GGDEF domain-containing protein [Actinoplanes nipponensis]GIE49115.1 hypothetical protein Ani05nite_26490 [Actinoplanes nipponensis]